MQAAAQAEERARSQHREVQARVQACMAGGKDRAKDKAHRAKPTGREGRKSRRCQGMAGGREFKTHKLSRNLRLMAAGGSRINLQPQPSVASACQTHRYTYRIVWQAN